ncbi:transposase DNA-binding-containing protein [Phenylobacterium sp.]|uniref:IS4/Tn5 family transposase DNA-binding protein n=1 Tax=Phenylobacterium sp. TaxID=1871053 RepID=UPI0025E249FD|nr:transposase DNA-binding-containing protein [Phenylobacterium sp.]
MNLPLQSWRHEQRQASQLLLGLRRGFGHLPLNLLDGFSAAFDRKVGEQLPFDALSTLPFAFQDWANTKAAYRFFSNAKVEEGDILSGHFAATRTRFDACDGPILLLQDTTEFTYQRHHWARTSWSAPASTAWPATEAIRFGPK